MYLKYLNSLRFEGFTFVLLAGSPRLLKVWDTLSSSSIMCFDGFKLSVNGIIVSQKGSNRDRKLEFFGRDYNFTRTLCVK